MSSTKKERIQKRHASRNRRILKKMVRDITNITRTLRYPQIIAKVGDSYFLAQSERNIVFKHGQDVQCELITRFPNKKEKYDEVMHALRSIYYFGDFSMKRNAYYTLKGMARKNPENQCVINFIKKHDYDGIYDGLIEYFNSEHLYVEHKLSVSCCSCTTMYSIDVNAGGGGDENKETEKILQEAENSAQA